MSENSSKIKQTIFASAIITLLISVALAIFSESFRKKFPTLLGAISQIQQFYFIEKKGQEISDDFLTIQGKMNFLQVGIGSGFIEGLSFAILTAIVIPILSDFEYMVWFGQYFPLVRSRLFPSSPLCNYPRVRESLRTMCCQNG